MHKAKLKCIYKAQRWVAAKAGRANEQEQPF